MEETTLYYLYFAIGVVVFIMIICKVVDYYDNKR